MMDAAPINQVALAARREARQGARVFVRVPLAKRFAFRRGLWRSLEFWRKGLAGKTPRSATEYRFAVEPAAAMRYDFAMVMIFGSNGFFRAHSRDLRLPYDRMSTMRISSCWELIVSFW